MKNNDELQFTPMMRGRIVYTEDEVKTSNIKNHGTKKGTVKYNPKKFVTTLVLTGSLFAISIGGIHAFKTMSSAPREIPPIGEPIPIEHQIEDVERVVCDYKVIYGDTLDGIIYKYTDSANEKDFYKNYVTYYNDIDNDMIRVGDVITLVGVPKDQADELNTGYDPSVDNTDEISVQLNGAVQDLLDYEKDNGEVVEGSLTDTITDELSVYNATTNKKTRSHLAKAILRQIENEREFGRPTVSPNVRSH